MTTQLTGWPTGEAKKVRARIAKHRKLDQIIQGAGWNGKQGCAIGCSLDNYSHEEYSRVVGGDLRLAALVDSIHESLSPAKSVAWPGRVAAAIKPGADLTFAPDKFFVWMLAVDLKRFDKDGVCARMAAPEQNIFRAPSRIHQLRNPVTTYISIWKFRNPPTVSTSIVINLCLAFITYKHLAYSINTVWPAKILPKRTRAAPNHPTLLIRYFPILISPDTGRGWI